VVEACSAIAVPFRNVGVSLEEDIQYLDTPSASLANCMEWSQSPENSGLGVYEAAAKIQDDAYGLLARMIQVSGSTTRPS